MGMVVGPFVGTIELYQNDDITTAQPASSKR
jgi:hypothetical protein